MVFSLLFRLFEAAESAKFTLSNEQNVTVSIPFIYEQNSLTCVLTRRKFEQLCKKLITRLLKPVREVCIDICVQLYVYVYT
jgi:molecular chaperone DnaK (HSP70)